MSACITSIRRRLVSRPSRRRGQVSVVAGQWNPVRRALLVTSENMLSFPAGVLDGSSVAYVANEVDDDLGVIPLDGFPIRPLLGSRLVEDSVDYSPRADEFAYVRAGEESGNPRPTAIHAG